MWILLVEDERDLAASLRRGLEEEGYTVEIAHDGEAGYDLAVSNPYDLLIVDRRLPRKDGLSLVELLRGQGFTYPVLMLTALGSIDDRVAGLNAGADDYLTKPFSFEELLARIRALIRRAQAPQPTNWIRLGPLTLDTLRRQVTVGGIHLWLRPKEYALLDALARRTGAVLTRTLLAERVWGNAHFVTDNVIDVHVSRLRQHLAGALVEAGAPADTLRIETIRGVGYRLLTPDE